MEFTGYILSLFIGISLGLIGGGGSVLTVPILVYLFRVEPVLATAYSLFIVGATSAAGALQKWNKSEINLRIALTFGLPSLVTVYLVRKFLIPLIPEIIFQASWLRVDKGTMMLVLFSLLMISSAIGMIKPQEMKRPKLPRDQALIALGISVGLISGLLGAGGGFIIIPALIFYASLDMKTAVGTSLLIIAVNSLIGFTGDLTNHPINWNLLVPITLLGILGTFAGNRLSQKIPPSGIRGIFAVFILIIGILILVKELFL